MSKKVLLTATVQSHICQFHKPLCRLLQNHGYEIHVAARDNLAEKNGLKMEYVDKVFDVPFDRSPFSTKNLKAYMVLRGILKENSYDVIHTNTPMGGMVTRIAANKYRRKNGTKVFYTAHGFHFYNGAPKKNWLIYYPIEKAMSFLTDTLITITNEDYELAKKKFHCKTVRIHGVGASSERFKRITDEEKAKLRAELGYDENIKIILNVGELKANKNQKAAIKAMAEIVKTYPKAKLLIAGNGEELDNHKALIKSLGLEKNVELLGYTTQIAKYMNICDCLVACSYREGLPLNLMEAMLCGKPVVASNNRGHRELIENGYNGYIVEPDDIRAYSEQIVKVLENASQFSDNAEEYVKLFTDNYVINELRDIYGL